MEYNCQLVQELYPLYVDRELSPETIKAVRDHLHSCAVCRDAYTNETGFSDILKKEQKKQPTPALDTKIRLQVRYRKLRQFAVIVSVLFIFTMFSSYSTSRNNLYHHVGQLQRNLVSLSHGFSYITHELSLPIETQFSTVHRELRENIYRSADWLERWTLGQERLQIDTALDAFLELMLVREAHDALSEQDLLALEAMHDKLRAYNLDLVAYLDNYQERWLFKILARPDFKRMHELVQEINTLARDYVVYDTFEASEPISPGQAEAVLRATLGFAGFDLEYEDISLGAFRPRNKADFVFALNEAGSRSGSVYADTYSGQLAAFHSHGLRLNEGNLLPREDVAANLARFLDRSAFDYTIEYLGINNQIEFSPAGPQLYSFRAVPSVEGYRIQDGELLFYIDARNGALDSIHSEFYWKYVDLPWPVPQLTEELSFEQALAEYDSQEELTYRETVIIRSMLTGKHELVHVYYGRSAYDTTYINARTGNQDLPLYELDGWFNLMK